MAARELSWWGWGWADRFPNEAGRKNLAQGIGAMLGFTGLELLPLPELEAVTLRASRVTVPASLAEFCSAGHRERICHTYGRSYPDILRGFRGDFPSPPDVVATPRSEREVEQILEWAERDGLAVVPVGGGTSVVGGANSDVSGSPNGVVALSLRGLSDVVEVDEVSRLARIQAGATGPELEAALGERGLTLRHFPQSFEHSTLGGWIATRAGGHFATVYTHIDDLVASARMLTPRGVWQSRRLPGSGAGPSPDRMVLGSEGAFGVITEGWMRVRPRPTFRASATVRYADFDRAVAAVRAIAQSGLFPSNCRLLDKREAALNGVTSDGTHVLVLGFESADHAGHPAMERALAIARGEGGATEGARFREGDSKSGAGGAAGKWRSAFIDAPYLQSTLVSLGVIADTFETACTWQAFPALHQAVVSGVRAAMREVAGKGRISCRFTHVYPDGPAPYYTWLCPAKVGGELEQWARVKQAAGDALMAHDATITHHHAVGRIHKPWYAQQRPAPFGDVLAAIKGAVDPAGIMNPGVLF